MKVIMVLFFYAVVICVGIPGVFMTPSDSEKNVNDDDDFLQKVVGGHEARIHSRPYQVAIIQKTEHGVMFCGGSLVAKNYVLTAAHCISPFPTEYTVVFGAHSVKDGLEVKTIESIVHPNWNPSLLLNDLALLKLPFDVPLNGAIQIIDLPPKFAHRNSFVGSPATVSGWGKTSDDGPNAMANVLEEATMQVIPNFLCNQYYGGIIQPSHICVNGATGKSSCSGDSGGPLTTKYFNKTIQIGIVSFGSKIGCQKGYPSVYTRVDNYVDWIRANTGQVY